MLGERNAEINIAVSNLENSRKFYRDILGLNEIGSEMKEIITLKSGSTTIYVYSSQYAGTNKATAVTWVVGPELENVVKALKEKGVTFEHYDLPDMTLEGDIHIFSNTKAAWFKDPDGNLLNLVNQ